MTFVEAATMVLERAGRPMHYSEIAQAAIEQDLLSHIGKTPEQAMQTRLSVALRREPNDSGLVRLGPGTYALQKWGLPEGKDQPIPSDPPSGVAPPSPLPVAAERPRPGKAAPAAREPSEAHQTPDQTPARPTPGSPASALVDADTEEVVLTAEQRSRRRKKRRKRANGEPSADLATATRRLLESRGQSIELTELRGLLRSRGISSDDLDRGLSAALRSHNALCRVRRQPEPFVLSSRGEVQLAERILGPDLLRLEQRIREEVERWRESSCQLVARLLEQLPLSSVVDLVRVCLAHAGRPETRLLRTIGSTEAQLLALPLHPGEGSLVVRVLRQPRADPRELKKRAADLRSSLAHHEASSGLLVLPLAVEPASRAELNQRGQPPVDLWDSRDLAERMERAEIGFTTQLLHLPVPDLSFFMEFMA